MARHEPGSVDHVACIGAGVIGSGWVAHFLARGYRVSAWDPAPDGEARMNRLVDAAWPALESLGLAPGAGRDRLRFAPSLAEAVGGAAFVQESAPDRLDLKVKLLAEIDAAAPPETVIASSTSGFGMTEMQAQSARPERLVVGHPFNPPYLVPLVEVVGGEKTAADAVDWACAFYEAAGKTAVKMTREVPGFIANRLQEALWYEALHMVAAGEATVEEIDTALTAGPGLRWAFMGPFLTFHLAGGEGGMGHMLDHWPPGSMDPAWTRLVPPRVEGALRDRIVEGCEDEAAGRDTSALIGERDRKLIAVLKALREA